MTVSATARQNPSHQQSYDDALAQNGRTFHWARRFLGKTHGANGARLYAFCRLLDDLADGDLPNGKARLATISDDLKALSQRSPSANPSAIPSANLSANLSANPSARDPAMADFAPFMIERGLPASALRHLIDGLLFDQGHVALESEDDLVKYGYQVAGTVGLMMCPILSCYEARATDYAIDLGIAMQLTNIARDVLEDAQMGRRYLPGEWVGNMSAAQIANAAATTDTAAIARVADGISRTLTLADSYYESGLSGLAFLPKRAQIAIGIAAHAYRQIGVQLSARGLAWQQGRTVTSTATKARVSLRAIPYLLPQSRPRYHDDSLHRALQGYAK